MAIEERSLTEQPLERNDRTIAGYAAVFNSRSSDLGGFVEEIAPSAFKKTLQEADQRSFWNHDQSKPIGRRSAGTLRLEVDDTGLRYEVDVPKTSYGDDLLESIERGDVKESSFGFRTIQQDFERRDGQIIRTLVEVALSEVSPVSIPAYPAATIGKKRAAVEEYLEKRGLHLEDIDPIMINDKKYIAKRRDNSSILVARQLLK